MRKGEIDEILSGGYLGGDSEQSYNPNTVNPPHIDPATSDTLTHITDTNTDNTTSTTNEALKKYNSLSKEERIKRAEAAERGISLDVSEPLDSSHTRVDTYKSYIKLLSKSVFGLVIVIAVIIMVTFGIRVVTENFGTKTIYKSIKQYRNMVSTEAIIPKIVEDDKEQRVDITDGLITEISTRNYELVFSDFVGYNADPMGNYKEYDIDKWYGIDKDITDVLGLEVMRVRFNDYTSSAANNSTADDGSQQSTTTKDNAIYLTYKLYDLYYTLKIKDRSTLNLESDNSSTDEVIDAVIAPLGLSRDMLLETSYDALTSEVIDGNQNSSNSSDNTDNFDNAVNNNGESQLNNPDYSGNTYGLTEISENSSGTIGSLIRTYKYEHFAFDSSVLPNSDTLGYKVTDYGDILEISVEYEVDSGDTEAEINNQLIAVISSSENDTELKDYKVYGKYTHDDNIIQINDDIVIACYQPADTADAYLINSYNKFISDFDKLSETIVYIP